MWSLVLAAVSDCERLHDGLVAQPVNALTSLVYIATGLWTMRLATTRVGVGWLNPRTFGLVLVALGMGSFGFHGPQGEVARWLHSYSIAGVVLFVIALNLAKLKILSQSRAQQLALVVALALVPIFIVWRNFDVAFAVPAVVVAVVLDMLALRQVSQPAGTSVRYAAIAAVIVGAGVLNALGRTDGALCSPSSLWQLHGAWHVLTATALGAWATIAFPRQRVAS